jgi:hypothetical protein
MSAQTMCTEGVEVHEDGGMSFTGREAVNLYAFTMLRNAVIFRIKHGRSMLRGQEARMAQNYGWSTRSRFTKALLDDLNKVARENGLPEKTL